MEKINIAEILKNCPKGMDLYSPLCGDCKLYDVNDYNIRIETPSKDTLICLHHDGKYLSNGEIMLFPKNKTTWEGFVPPCKFNDGDICYIKTEVFEHIFIFKVNEDSNLIRKYVNLSETYFYTDKSPICSIDDIKEIRLATKEEKQKLFDAIKANGYKGNPENKTLEKLIEPNFKVGDIIQDNGYEVEITKVNVEDELYEYKSINTKTIGSIAFSKQDYWELVSNKFDVTTLKPFKSEVLVRDTPGSTWLPCFFEGLSDINDYPYRIVGGESWKCCIPYEGNEHLLGKKDDCTEYYKNW